MVNNYFDVVHAAGLVQNVENVIQILSHRLSLGRNFLLCLRIQGKNFFVAVSTLGQVKEFGFELKGKFVDLLNKLLLLLRHASTVVRIVVFDVKVDELILNLVDNFLALSFEFGLELLLVSEIKCLGVSSTRGSNSRAFNWLRLFLVEHFFL